MEKITYCSVWWGEDLIGLFVDVADAEICAEAMSKENNVNKDDFRIEYKEFYCYERDE